MKKLQRNNDKKILAGVCAGVADYLSLDVNIVRLAWAVLTLFTGVGIILYIAGWLLMPDSTTGKAYAEGVLKQAEEQVKKFQDKTSTPDAPPAQPAPWEHPYTPEHTEPGDSWLDDQQNKG